MDIKIYTYRLSDKQFDRYTDPDRGRRARGNFFSDVTAEGESVPHKGIALIHSGEKMNAIFAVAAFKRTGHGATGRPRFKVFEIHRIRPVPADTVIPKLKSALAPYARDAFLRNRALPPATADDLVTVLMRASDDFARAYRSISPMIGRHRSLDRPGIAIRAQQKDAVTLSLDIAGVDREALASADRTTDSEAPFLAGVSSYRANEDSMIAHDVQFFEGVRSVPGIILGNAVFELGDGRRLTVFNANRGPIERALGVDLVYYNHIRRSYLLLQYKRMIQEHGAWRYRGDEQFRKEVRRMLRHNTDSPSDAADDYRLNALPFYFKFVRHVDYQAGSLNLLPGLYVPLEHLTQMMNSKEFTTKNGNLTLDHARTPHLKSGLFTGLAADGLIGSRGTATDRITELCTRALNGDRSVILSVEDAPQSR